MLRKQALMRSAQQAKGIGTVKSPVVTAADVRPGDLIFYEATGEDPAVAVSAPIGSGRVHHVEICTAAGKITSEINLAADVGRGFPELRHTRTTNLTPKKKDRLVVMRCTNELLRKSAAEYAVRWDDMLIPFSANRLHAATSQPNDVPSIRAAFKTSGRFRAIRYAARRGGDVHENGDDPRPTKGMFCSHFVVACYQVAGLSAAVKAAPPGTRVQDKKAQVDLSQWSKERRALIEGFNHYRVRDDSNDPSPSPRAGIEFWQFDTAGDPDTFSWDKAITTGMMVDAKLVMPLPLLRSVQADNVGWVLLGVILPTQ